MAFNETTLLNTVSTIEQANWPPPVSVGSFMYLGDGFSSDSTITNAVKQGYYAANYSTAEPYPTWDSNNPAASDVDWNAIANNNTPSSGSHRVKIKTMTTGYLTFEITKVIYVLDNDSEPQYASSMFETSSDLEVNITIYLYNEDETGTILSYWSPIGMAFYMTEGGTWTSDKLAVWNKFSVENSRSLLKGIRDDLNDFYYGYLYAEQYIPGCWLTAGIRAGFEDYHYNADGDLIMVDFDIIVTNEEGEEEVAETIQLPQKTTKYIGSSLPGESFTANRDNLTEDNINIDPDVTYTDQDYEKSLFQFKDVITNGAGNDPNHGVNYVWTLCGTGSTTANVHDTPYVDDTHSQSGASLNTSRARLVASTVQDIYSETLVKYLKGWNYGEFDITGGTANWKINVADDLANVQAEGILYDLTSPSEAHFRTQLVKYEERLEEDDDYPHCYDEDGEEIDCPPTDYVRGVYQLVPEDITTTTNAEGKSPFSYGKYIHINGLKSLIEDVQYGTDDNGVQTSHISFGAFHVPPNQTVTLSEYDYINGSYRFSSIGDMQVSGIVISNAETIGDIGAVYLETDDVTLDNAIITFDTDEFVNKMHLEGFGQCVGVGQTFQSGDWTGYTYQAKALSNGTSSTPFPEKDVFITTMKDAFEANLPADTYKPYLVQWSEAVSEGIWTMIDEWIQGTNLRQKEPGDYDKFTTGSFQKEADAWGQAAISFTGLEFS